MKRGQDQRDDPEHRNSLQVGLEALAHFESSIGIRMGDAYRRWNMLPPVLVPRHVSDRHGITARDSLFGLLDDAILAYVAGASGAAVAMCRAILERTLKDHYLPHEAGDLCNLIDLATARFAHVEGKRLHKIRLTGNRLLHRRKDREVRQIVDDTTILEHFRDLKFLIERAPAS